MYWRSCVSHPRPDFRPRDIFACCKTGFWWSANSACGLCSAKRNKPPRPLVPKCEPYAAEAFEQCEPAHVAQFGMIAQGLRQPIVRNAAAQVMGVMHADIGGEPAQNSRQVIIRAAV